MKRARPAPPPLAEAERLERLRLIRCAQVGPVTFRALLRQFGTARAALDALPELARRGGKSLTPPPPDEAEREWRDLERLGGRFLFLGQPDYPPLLAHIEDAPPLLAALGDPALGQRPKAVALVGARNASANGRRFAASLARELGERGFVVVSGLARGIDAAAHEGALESGTIAANAGGVDVAYPPENTGIHHDITRRGLVVSEMPLGLQPQGRHFPRRNRLVSGLALGVVVVEAARRSGSMITARLAGEQGREVMGVPGSPLDPRAQGCNGLIRSGATLVESAADIEEALGGLAPAGLAEPPERPLEEGKSPGIPGDSEVAAAREGLAELLSPTPVAVDELIRQCQLSPAVVHLALLELELAGRLERHPGGRVCLIAGA